ncbi:MAG: V-type ATP synthase subunit E [Acetivibrionales bacterium]|jgi:V/A-type H+-transporting ATPase subunit E
MNGAEKIKERILTDAKNLYDKIVNEAEAQAQSIIAEAEKEAFQKTTIITEKAREEAILIKQRYKASESMEDRKNILKVRQECIDEAFDVALKNLSDMPDDKYELFIEGLILNTIKNEDGIIIFNERDKSRLGERFISRINQKLKAKGHSGILSMAKDTLNSTGGFILRYGEMEINCTLEILLNMQRPNLESEVAKILFNE